MSGGEPGEAEILARGVAPSPPRSDYVAFLREAAGRVCSGRAAGRRDAGPVAVSHGYRPDIDGLRALAVIPVVLFHLQVGMIRGGYVGVDVFFVISGFLITGILNAEIAAGRFSIAAFYDRRIRRILPALFVVMAFCFAVAPFLLFPPEIIDFAKSALSATLFAANMFFMATTDYFNAGETSPLLHTWSLAVEEQFYIVFPIVLWLLRGKAVRTKATVLAALALASFAASVMLVRTNQIEAFYLSPPRAWELLIGALLAIGIFPAIASRWLREAMALAGLALIVASCLLFYRNMAFPGERALAPCLGAAMIIHAGAGAGPRTIVTRLLSGRILVRIGLISYSLYLWHWPIIVFYGLGADSAPGSAETALLFGASLLAAYASWRYVERPFRRRTWISAPVPLRWLAAAAGAAIVLGATFLVRSDGLASTFTPQATALSGYLHYDDRAVYRRGSCFIDSHSEPLSDFDAETCLARSTSKPNVLLIGDSHAAQLWSGLNARWPATNVLQASVTGCKPTFETRGPATCLALMRKALRDEANAKDVAAVVLAARWEEKDVEDLTRTARSLAASGRPVFVAGPIVEYRQSLPRILARVAEGGDERLLISERNDEPGRLDHELAARLSSIPGVTYLSTFRVLCRKSGSACSTVAGDGAPLQWDYGHLTAAGSNFVVADWLTSGLLVLPPAKRDGAASPALD